MELDRTLAGLSWLRDKTTCFACSGCGMEHNCSDDGCRIIRSAIEQVQKLSRELSTSEAARTELWKQLISARQELDEVKAAQQKGGVSMERLTKRDIDGCLIHPWSFNRISGSYDIWDEDLLEKQIDRLAAYEDSGLEPEEIERIVDAYGRGHTLRTESAERLEIVREIKADRLRELVQAEKEGRLVELPFVAMVEQSLQDGKMKPMGDQKHNGRYAVVYVDHNKWKSPLIDICGKPYNREEAENRMAVLAQKGGEG